MISPLDGCCGAPAGPRADLHDAHGDEGVDGAPLPEYGAGDEDGHDDAEAHLPRHQVVVLLEGDGPVVRHLHAGIRGLTPAAAQFSRGRAFLMGATVCLNL